MMGASIFDHELTSAAWDVVMLPPAISPRAETLASVAVMVAEMLPLAETFAVVPAVTSAETSSSEVRSMPPPAVIESRSTPGSRHRAED